MKEIIRQPSTNRERKWEKIKSYTGGFKGDSWLCKKGNTSRMIYFRDDQPERRKEEAKEQTNRQSTGRKAPHLSM